MSNDPLLAAICSEDHPSGSTAFTSACTKPWSAREVNEEVAYFLAQEKAHHRQLLRINSQVKWGPPFRVLAVHRLGVILQRLLHLGQRPLSNSLDDGSDRDALCPNPAHPQGPPRK